MLERGRAARSDPKSLAQRRPAAPPQHLQVVGRVRHRLRLHRGVDGHATEMLLLDGTAALRGLQALGQQPLHPLGADPLAPARQ